MRIIECAACVIALNLFGCSAGNPAAPGEAPVESASQEEALKLRKICDGPSDRACSKGEYCNSLVAGRCPGPRTFGTCASEPGLCSELFAPVCGCDGATYPNSCFAAASGVAVEHPGACANSGPTCGGIAGIPCAGSGRCVDDPSDNCDPAAGGADCSGICSCIETVLCRVGSHFDADPSICACVADAASK